MGLRTPTEESGIIHSFMIVTPTFSLKIILEACYMKNVFNEFTIQEMVLTVLPHRKWFLGVCQTENGFRGLPHGKCFLDVCHTEHGSEGLASLKMPFGGLSQTENVF